MEPALRRMEAAVAPDNPQAQAQFWATPRLCRLPQD
jgi:hypothetical protein